MSLFLNYVNNIFVLSFCINNLMKFCVFRQMAVSRGTRDDPVPPPLLVPMCHCGILAQVKQSRDEAIAGRAFYTCARKWTK
jgi:hypothetical protein